MKLLEVLTVRELGEYCGLVHTSCAFPPRSIPQSTAMKKALDKMAQVCPDMVA